MKNRTAKKPQKKRKFYAKKPQKNRKVKKSTKNPLEINISLAVDTATNCNVDQSRKQLVEVSISLAVVTATQRSRPQNSDV